MSSDTKRTFPALLASNWGQWSEHILPPESYGSILMVCILSLNLPIQMLQLLQLLTRTKELLDWKQKTAKASGELWLAIEDNQKVHVKELKGDPAAMWMKLKSIHLQQKPGA